MNDTETKKPGRKRLWWTIAGLATLLSVTAAVIGWTAASADREMRVSLLEEARMVAMAVNTARVSSLSGSAADLDSAHYHRLKEQLSLIRGANPKCHFVYLVGRRAGGKLFFYVDSEPAGSKEESPPGQAYQEAPDSLRRTFDTGREITEGPYSDRWGTWVSAFVPIGAPSSQGYTAVFGMDVKATNWRWDIAGQCAFIGGLALFLAVLGGMVIVLGLSRQRFQSAHQSAVRSESTLRAVTDTTQNAILMMDREGKIRFFNPAAERMFGWLASEAVGADLHQLLAPARYHTAFARGFEGFQQRGTGAAVGKTLELTALHKDGREFPVEISLSGVQLHSAWHGVGIIRDISDRKQMEASLRQSEERHRILFLSSRDAIMTLEPPSWRFTSGNPACLAMFGARDEAEFTSCGPWDLTSERQPDGRLSQDCAKEMIETAMREGSHFFEFQHKRLGGAEFPATVLLTRLEIGGHAFLQATVRDISNQKQMEAELGQAQKLEAVGRLAAGIAHEINTPTQYVGDNIEFLQVAHESLIALAGIVPAIIAAGEQNPIPSPLLDEARRLVEAANLEYITEQIPRAIDQSLEGMGRIATIVQAMKEFSHPGVTEKTAVDLNQCIRSTTTVSRSEWKYVADLDLALDEGLPQVLCLAGDFNQAVLNIIVNAAHAISDAVGGGATGKGKITIGTRRNGAWAEIQISDTGTGMPEKIRERIFDPFFTTKEVGRGTGQGLAIARNVIVDKHGGTITVESEIGKGTTFTIRLPIEGAIRSCEAAASADLIGYTEC